MLVLSSRNIQNNRIKLSNNIDKVRLLFVKDKEPYLCFYKILGFYPRNIKVYKLAFVHKSTYTRSDKGHIVNNERLEFLGDSILDSVIADILYRRFEGKREGFLTNTRSKIVQRETLNRLALDLGLDRLVKTSNRSQSHNNYMYGNAFEALVGAIYLDRGYYYCKYFIENKVMRKYINLEQVLRTEVNFKSKLIEWGQKHRFDVSFDVIEEFINQENSPVFQSEVFIQGLSAGVGTGFSKKESQQNAASIALSMIKKKDFVDLLLSEKEKTKNLSSQEAEDISADTSNLDVDNLSVSS